MYEEKEGLYSIGALSKIVNISTDTLRYYDDFGLVKPAFTSEQTGYRYYSDNQAALIARIIELKQYGFSLGEIKEILANGETPPIGAYQARYMALLREKRRLDEVIGNLSSKILQMQEGLIMQKNILLVDDATFMRMMWRDILGREGYEIVGDASDGNAAVELHGRLKPDLLLMDIVMPNMDGICALQEIRKQSGDVKAVMCSAMGQAYIVTESLLAGANDFVVKPFQPERLVNAVRVAFHEERVFNRNTLQRIHDCLCDDKMYILAQNEIDEIIRLSLAPDISDAEIDAFIQRMEHMQRVAPAVNNDRAEAINSTALALLTKVEQGQEEIKAMLTQLLDAKR